MKKTISQAALKARQAKKAKPEEVTPAPPTPEPTLPTQDTTQLAERTIEASMRMEHAVQQSMAISDENLRQVKEALQKAMELNSQMNEPIAYDLIINRRRDGLMESVRLQPVTGMKH